MDILEDFANSAYEKIGRYKCRFTLSPHTMNSYNYAIKNLQWNSIKFKTGNKNDIPNDKRGIYAFVISADSKIPPPHGYIMYIGIAGKYSYRSLRARYSDYLNERTVLKRRNIAYMIGTWSTVLQFFFAPIENDISSDDLQKLEKQLNSEFIPPFVRGDLYADVRHQAGAFDQ